MSLDSTLTHSNIYLELTDLHDPERHASLRRLSLPRGIPPQLP